MYIQTDLSIGQIVYLKTDRDQCERIITGINIRPGEILYRLNCVDMDSFHYSFEISMEKDPIKSCTN